VKKPLCVTTVVFGERYQEFIPLFLYSLLRAYPEYEIILFVNGRIAPRLRPVLDGLRKLGFFEIRENYLSGLNLTGYRGMATRWLVYDSRFTEFEALYAGDIDILILPESPKLHEQHNTHCQVIGLPYSNVRRPVQTRRIKKDPISLVKRFRRFGLGNTLRALTESQIEIRQLSGLHYMQTEPYFRAALPKMLEFATLLGDERHGSLLRRPQYLDGFDNEAFLFDLIEESRLGLPPHTDYGPHLLDYKQYTKPGFRPHHGIHLGIFRSPEMNPADKAILRLPCYREYYAHYKQEMRPEPRFQALLKASPEWLQAMFTRMERGFEAVAAAE
jgi:hypothetical protein